MRDPARRRKVFQGRLLTLYRERRRYPNGNDVDLEVIIHPGAVLIVPFLGRDRIVMIRQYRPVIDAYIWELPAGTLKKGEAPLRCARRELIEETGYRCTTLKKVGLIYPAPGYTNEKIAVYEAWGLSKVASRPEDDEVITASVVTKKEAARLFAQRRIVDAKTICALAFAKVI